MAPPLLHLQDIHLALGQSALLSGAELQVGARERLCVVGRNGSGKSTLLRIAAGLAEPDEGSRFLQPGTTIRYLSQEPDFGKTRTTLEFVESGLGESEIHRAPMMLDALGLQGDEDPARLSGGERRRAALAQIFAPEPDILLLDEPTNHLDIAMIEALEAIIKGLRSAVVIVSHDRRFLETLSEATLWLDRGTTRLLDKGFAAFEAWRDAVLEEEELERHKLDRKIAREEDWLRYGVSARRKRNQRRLADLVTLRAESAAGRKSGPVGDVKLTTVELRRSGKLVIEAEGLSKSFGDRQIVRDFSIKVEKGDRLGIVGPNGAGKTTLIRMLIGELEPDQGSVKLGSNLDTVTIDQRREALSPEATLADTLTGGGGDTVIVGGSSRHVIGYMKDFLFRPEQARTPVKVLSGGERSRLMLARAMVTSANLLVFDEPTNDLDLETLDLLQEMLADFDGTLILVSHDRDFLDRVVTATLVGEGEGVWTQYAGGYSDMLSQRGADAGVQPAARAQKKAPAPSSAGRGGQTRRKLSFSEQHALKQLPRRIETLTADVRKLERELADPDLYARDPDRFNEAGQAHEAARKELDAAEEEWLRLEYLREQLESN